MSGASKPVIRIRPDQSVGVLDFAEIWRYRILLRQMVRRQFVARVATSPLSLVWSFIRPAIMTATFFYLRRATDADFGADIPYPLYLFSGFCLWFLFADTVGEVASSLAADASVIQRVYFPRLISPLAIVLSRVFDLAAVLVAIGAMQAVLGVATGPRLIFILPIGALLLLLALAIGAAFAALQLFHQDTRRALEVILYLGLFLSPVIYSADIFDGAARMALSFNPMTGVLSGMRGALFAPMAIDWVQVMIAAGVTGFLLAVGLAMFAAAARVVGERL